MSATPRRCSKHWLDGDCPREVLAIFDHPRFFDRFTIVYAQTYAKDEPSGPWQGYVSCTRNGAHSHGEMPASEVAAYRYREKHRYARWSDLPDAVKRVVRDDIARME